MYIAIDGRGGSGKTHLANLLATRLRGEVFQLDYFGNDHEPFVGIPKLIEAVDASRGEVTIFEGVGVFDARFDRFHPLRVFVNTPPELRKKRAEGRDVPRADRSQEEWKKIYEIWKEAEASYFTGAVISRADIVVADSGSREADEIMRRLT